MSKKTQSENLIITNTVRKKALRYAMSLNEVGFLFFGKKGRIIEVVRIKNIHEQKEDRFKWDIGTYRATVELYSRSGFNLIAEGHSHSKKNHLRRPSKADLKYFKRGLHVIVFPCENKIRCWVFSSSIRGYGCREILLKRR